MELILQKGRPITKERRLDKEVRCYDLLDSLGIEYERVDHEPAMTIEACAAVDEDVLNAEYFGCHPCINTSSLKLRTKDVFETFLQAVHHDYMVVHL